MELEEIREQLRYFLPHGGTVGIIGYGMRGQAVADAVRLEHLELLICDPPRAEEESAGEFCEICTQWGNGMGGCTYSPDSEVVYLPLSYVLKNSDLVVLAVPLTGEGTWQTQGMVNDSFCRQMRPGAMLWNLSGPQVMAEKN